MRTTIMLALPLLAGLALSTAAEPPAKDRSAAVAKWIEQLGDSDPQKRDEALEKLEAEGAAALPALRQGLTHPDPEVRRRLRDLVPELEARIILAPKRVTLKMTGTIPDVLKEITKQTGYKVESWGGAPPQQQAHTFDFAAVPFWEAIDRIGQQTGLVVQTGYGDNRVVLQPQDAINPYVWHEGPFRFVANSVQQNRQIDLTLRPRNGPPPVARNESMTFSFTVFVEPKLPILGVGEARLAAAYDNERNSLVPPTPPAEDPLLGMPGVVGRGRWTSGRYSNRGLNVQTQVPLLRVSEKASTIKLIKGSVPVNLLAEQKPVLVTDKLLSAKGQKMKVGTIQIAIEDVQQTPTQQYQVSLNLSNENAEDYSWTNSMYQRMEVQDAKGNRLPQYGSSWGGAVNAIRMTMTFGAPNAKSEPPAQLIFQSWTTMETTANFEFRDIPLP